MASRPSANGNHPRPLPRGAETLLTGSWWVVPYVEAHGDLRVSVCDLKLIHQTKAAQEGPR